MTLKGRFGLFFRGEIIRQKGRNGLFLIATQHRLMLLSVHHRRYEVLRKHLRTLRRSAGLTQAELGARLKVDQSHVSKVERGERYMDVLFYLDWCRACKLRPEETVLDLIKAGA